MVNGRILLSLMPFNNMGNQPNTHTNLSFIAVIWCNFFRCQLLWHFHHLQFHLLKYFEIESAFFIDNGKLMMFAIPVALDSAVHRVINIWVACICDIIINKNNLHCVYLQYFLSIRKNCFVIRNDISVEFMMKECTKFFYVMSSVP